MYFSTFQINVSVSGIRHAVTQNMMTEPEPDFPPPPPEIPDIIPEVSRMHIAGNNQYFIKVRLHGRFLLRFQLRFSPFGGCEGVDQL